MVFTKLMRPLLAKWRSQGISIAVYLDDGLIWSDSAHRCNEFVQVIREDLDNAGFRVAEEKCTWIPLQKLNWLGHIIDLKSFSLNLSQERRLKCRKIASRLLYKRGPSLLDRMKWQGTFASMHLVIPLEKRRVWKAVVTSLAKKEQLGTALTYRWALDQAERTEILGWLRFDTEFQGISMTLSRHLLNAIRGFSDASELGVGSVLYLDNHDKIFSSTNLPADLIGASSTARELFAILLGLEAFSGYLLNEEVVWHCDNQAAIVILTKGSTKPDLQILAQRIWNLCDNLRVRIEFVWISREFNTEADEASREIDLDDWCIRDEIFEELQRVWGKCTVDMFASTASRKCERFVSRDENHAAVAHDAFLPLAQIWWTVSIGWWVPPPFLIAQTLLCAKANKSRGILGFPMWASHLFFPILRDGNGWIPQIKQFMIFPAGSPVLKGGSLSYTFGGESLDFDFAFALISF
ncbi:hypothetical protein RB195_014047 [Necator americanus]|uniref:Reverse transcriptase domain-containing protein n=1 Tax=Necator americanus TaxID=51031 RepID=A0ABR1DZZ9_NECAM